MNRISITLISMLMLLSGACQEQLDVSNPNSPPFQSIQNEEGMVSFAMGGIYNMQTKYSGAAAQWTTVYGFHELMGDAIGTEDGTSGSNQIGCPDMVMLDNGASVPNPFSPSIQKEFIRQRNVVFSANNNPLFYEWAIMYALNNSANMILSNLDKVEFSGDAKTKINVLKTWAFFWKGFAYSKIGSMYHAGIINNDPLTTNNEYVSREEVMNEAELNFAAAYNTLSTLSAGPTYTETLGKLIPSFCQGGVGGILTPDMWKRQINTMRARNILVNGTVDKMLAEQWNAILTLTGNGVNSSDKVFIMRSNTTSDIVTAGAGNVAARTGGMYQVSERLVQDFKPGDKRLANNFRQAATFIGSPARGNSFNTRWQLIDGGSGMSGVVVLQNRKVGLYDTYMTAFFEENELMKAEASIYTGKVDAGLAIVDALRTRQGAGLPPSSGAGLSQAAAIAELFSERRVALAFRGFSFYDARRYNKINTDRNGAVVIDKSGNVNTNATIRYNFMDYWDVPDNELAYNPPSPDSAPVKNPN